ncbi:MAG: hypothetical protein GEV10_16705 [Streptosporangiales bacterium]|nr:hypothetical protein [Streptosporangiales bacterium]
MAQGWAIIGIGKLADVAIAPAIASAAGCELVAVCSRDLGRAKAFAGRHGVATAYDDLAAMVADDSVDVVYIATPNGLHRAHALTAMRAGRHVLVDKPLAVTVADGREMVEAASAAGVRLGTGFQMRHKETNLAARASIRAGDIGRAVFLDIWLSAGKDHFPYDTWRSDTTLAGGGTVLNQGTHVIDLLQFLADSPIVEVSCVTDVAPLEDVFAATCRLDNGALATIASNQVLGGTPRDWVAVGTEGWLEGRRALAAPGGDELTLHRGDATTVLARSTAPAYAREVEEFAAAVREQRQPNGSGEDGLRTIAVVDALYRAAREARTVTVDLP